MSIGYRPIGLRHDLERRAVRTLSEADYLLGVADVSRMGALRFSREGGGVYEAPTAQGVPGLVDLGSLMAVTERIGLAPLGQCVGVAHRVFPAPLEILGERHFRIAADFEGAIESRK